MTNETKPVLLTEADWERLMHEVLKSGTLATIKAELRERGLIAPEPVDPLEAAVVNALEADGWSFSTASAHTLAAALRGQGIGLAKLELTREMVREAVREHIGSVGNVNIDRLHAALTKGEGA